MRPNFNPALILAAVSMLSLAGCERQSQPVDVFVPPTGKDARPRGRLRDVGGD